MIGRITPIGEPLPRPAQVFVSADERIATQYPELHDAAMLGVLNVIGQTASKLPVKKIGSSWDDGPYGSVAWFTDRARVQISYSDGSARNPQILSNTMHNDLRDDRTRWTAPHIGYMLLSEDMVTEQSDGSYTNFVLGSTDKWTNQSVQSSYRFLAAGMSESESFFATWLMALHETGHVVGLDETTIVNQDPRAADNEIYIGHCADECSMQQVMSVDETLDLALDRWGKPNAGFCDDCTAHLRTV